jgi:hypothetical protein
MAKRKGLSGPTAHSRNALRIGTMLKVKLEDERTASMMLSALVRRESDVFALMVPHSKIGKVTSGSCQLLRARKSLRLGKFVEAEELLGKQASAFGFHVVQLDTLPLFKDLTSSAEQLSTTRDFSSNFWRGRNLRVRRLNDESLSDEPVHRKRNRRASWANRLGRMKAEIHDVKINDVQGQLFYPYCGVVSRPRGVELADKRAVGAPVISSSGALSGFIVGRNKADTLILPIDELSSDKGLAFLTFGEDWPKVRIADSKKTATA